MLPDPILGYVMDSKNAVAVVKMMWYELGLNMYQYEIFLLWYARLD
jgi:hypothetical protein